MKPETAAKTSGESTSSSGSSPPTPHVHRLVQDENAKTILLNVPLDDPSSVPRKKNLRDTLTANLSLAHSSRGGIRGGGVKSQRVRSASVGRDKASDTQARYWAFLFENLRRAVDDLYHTCESDESIPASKEVILVLENYVRDFKNLCDWLKLKWEFDNTPPPHRPTSLAWEVRKTSPAGKLTPTTALATQRLLMAAGPAKRALNFDDRKADEKVKETIKEIEISPVEEKENKEPGSAESVEGMPGPEKVQELGISKKTSERVAEKPGKEAKAKETKKKEDEAKDSTMELKATSKSTNVMSKSTSSISSSTSTSSLSSKSRSGSSSVLNKKTSTTRAPSKVSTASAPVTSTVGLNFAKNNASSSPKLHRSATSVKDSKSSTQKTVPQTQTPGNRDASPKPGRISLVARQSKTATSNPVKQPLTRAATTANLQRSKTTLVGNNQNRISNASRPLRALPTSTSGGTGMLSRASSNASTPSTPGAVHPYGSTSSVSSAGSCRSWADTVRGLKTPRSVENIHQISKSKSATNCDEADEGWEMVRPRTRSRYSPSAKEEDLRKRVGKKPLNKRDSLDSKMKVKHSAKTRFQTPSSAMSLPTLALTKEESDQSESSTSSSKHLSKNSTTTSRPVSAGKVPAAANVAKATLDRVAEAKTSSSESLSEKTNSSTTTTSKKKVLSSSSNSSVSSARVKSASSVSKLATRTDKDRLKKVTMTGDSVSTKPKPPKTVNNKSVQASSAAPPELPTPPKLKVEDIEQMEYEELGAISAKKFAQMLEGLSWADQVEVQEMYESRYPGRAIHLHEKLSSPARKKEPEEAFKDHQEKQKQARLRRERYQDEKAQRLGAKNAKIENVIAQKSQMINDRKELLEDKMKKAQEKRQQYIDGIRKKAHEEEAKLKEIAFINELQAQNSRIDMLTHSQTIDVKHEERLAELEADRVRKAEEREAKEARAEQRRKDIEAKRKKEMDALREKIKSREERILEEQEQNRKTREEAAREKARDREEKLSSVRAAEEDLKAGLQEKIQIKQEEAAKRHSEKLDRVRQKAFELSVQKCSTDDTVPTLIAYETRKKCDLCNVLILNEVHLNSHLRGKKHCEKVIAKEGKKLTKEEIQICNVQHIVDASADEPNPRDVEAKERIKALRKRSKKIKSRMAIRTAEYEKGVTYNPKVDAPNRGKIGKSLKDLDKLFSSHGKGSLPNTAITQLERALGEISRALLKNSTQDKACFFALNGFGCLSRIFGLMSDQKTSCIIPLKSVVSCTKAWTLASTGNRLNTEFVLKNNHLTIIVDILYDRLEILIPSTSEAMTSSTDTADYLPPSKGPQVDPVAKALLHLLAQTLEDLSAFLKQDGKTIEQGQPNDLIVRALDQISYIVSIGVIDKLASYLNSVQDPIDNSPEVGEFILSALTFMAAVTGVSEVLVKAPNEGNQSGKKGKLTPNDPTHLLQTFQMTDLAGTVSMLYGILLPQGGPTRCESNSPPKLSQHAVEVASATSKLLYRMMRQHMTMVQDVLGQEGISLEFRHIASYLLWYCQHYEERPLMHLVIVLVGYFAAGHADNQGIVQSGHQPSVLQQLCNLPFPYFSEPELKKILFPTLIATCHNSIENKGILTEEMSYQMLDDFIKSAHGKENHLVQLILAA